MNSFLEEVFVANPQGILVGGQAVIFWAEYFDIEVPAAAFTADIDFLGSADEAQDLADRLQDAIVHVPDLNDHTPQAAKISTPGKPPIDYMALVHGLDERQVRRRALKLSVGAGPELLIANPVDCLRTRVMNLSGRSDAHALAQTGLAIRFVHSWLVSIHESGDNRATFNEMELIAELALHPLGIRAAVHHDQDILEAVPVKLLSGTSGPSTR